MPIEIPERPSSDVTAALPPGARVHRGPARPLTGIEISKCLKECVREAAAKIGDEALVVALMLQWDDRLQRERWAGVEHLTWPTVRWLVRVYKGGERLWVDAVVQLSEATKVVIYVGETGEQVENSEELGQERTDIPDHIRQRWGLARLVGYIGTDGQYGQVEVGAPGRSGGRLRDIPEHVAAPPRFAKRVDVGGGIIEAPASEAQQPPLTAPPLPPPADIIAGPVAPPPVTPPPMAPPAPPRQPLADSEIVGDPPLALGLREPEKPVIKVKDRN